MVIDRAYIIITDVFFHVYHHPLLIIFLIYDIQLLLSVYGGTLIGAGGEITYPVLQHFDSWCCTRRNADIEWNYAPSRFSDDLVPTELNSVDVLRAGWKADFQFKSRVSLKVFLESDADGRVM